MIIPPEPNRTSFTDATLLLLGVMSGAIASIPIIMSLAIWFFVTLFITESFDDDILSVINSKSAFTLGSKIGLGIVLIAFGFSNFLIVAPSLLALALLNAFIKKYLIH